MLWDIYRWLFYGQGSEIAGNEKRTLLSSLLSLGPLQCSLNSILGRTPRFFSPVRDAQSQAEATSNKSSGLTRSMVPQTFSGKSWSSRLCGCCIYHAEKREEPKSACLPSGRLRLKL